MDMRACVHEPSQLVWYASARAIIIASHIEMCMVIVTYLRVCVCSWVGEPFEHAHTTLSMIPIFSGASSALLVLIVVNRRTRLSRSPVCQLTEWNVQQHQQYQ